MGGTANSAGLPERGTLRSTPFFTKSKKTVERVKGESG